MKHCSGCKQTKKLDAFHSNKSTKDGLSNWCKDCNHQQGQRYQSDYYARNADRLKQNAKERGPAYYQEHRAKKLQYQKEYRTNNPQQQEQWRADNQEQIRQYAREYSKKRYRNDPVFKLKVLMRTRLRRALNGQMKPESVLSALGCTPEQLKKHLENQFTTDMTWENHGQWHIDHIRPLASFNLEDAEEYRKACHYTNLQPLWASDNLKKSKH